MEDKVFNYKTSDSLKDLAYASKQTHIFNTTYMTRDERYDFLSKFLGEIKESSLIKPSLVVDFGYNIFIGSNTVLNANITILDRANVTIGNNVLIGPNTSMYTSIHPLDIKSRNENKMIAREINISDNVWIGGNVVIYPGVTIGEGSVVSAGSVVIDDTIKNGLYSGNPATLIKVINQDEIDNKFK